MNRTLTHRGPDDEGLHVDAEAGVALGARRLSIIDVAGGHQPLSNEDGSVWAALNGEIYNHPRLQEELRRRGHALATGTDTEVLVHLYEDYGDALVHALEGMFAFALWDARRGRLLLGRDRFGEKPLFYVEGPAGLAFASELSALRAAGAASDDLDPAALDAYFVFGYVPGPDTIVQGVRQVPPGHLLIWDRESRRSRLERYWAPPDGSGGFDADTGMLIPEVRALLEESVRSRMIADVPLGVFLSGGVDSSLIAALAATNSREPVKTFTVGYDVGSVNETDAARATAAALGTQHHELLLTEADVGERAPPLLAALDQPLADQALVALHAVAEFARREVTVVVGGEGADELFCGYPRYRWLARAQNLGRVIPSGLRALGARMIDTAPLDGRAERLAAVLRPQSAIERHMVWFTYGRRHLRGALYGPLLHSLEPGRVASTLDALTDAGADTMARFMRQDQLHYLPDDVLMKADRASMLVSLEVRTPFLNREVAEFAAAVPTAVHARDHGKYLLRTTLRDAMPKAREGRRKRAFRVPVADWLRGPLSGVLRAQVERGMLYEEGWFAREPARNLVDEHLAGRADWSAALWPMLAGGLWLDRFRGVDG
jgi:asparagine synthase (glutamine-hydrolysing)